ncbi:MAG: hypothetical protein ACR2HN_03205 [Tepidiformaceae bacterium]
MDHQSDEHGAHAEHTVHLPDPSVWPLVAGVAAMLLGAALVWWSNDSSGSFTGPLLGAALVVTLLATAGWAYEDGRMKRKAELGEHVQPRDARYTQVVTFAIAEGRLTAARAEGGVLHSIERSDSILRDLNGFQDMRIIASPIEAGPSQVLVETTWSGREGLATYEETRRTMLDIVNAHPEDVLAGSTQVFDMEVVRDTKEVGFRFGMGAALTVLGSLVLGGFMVGAGITAFENNAASAGDGENGAAPAGDSDCGDATCTLIARDNRFPQKTLVAAPNSDIVVSFENKGRALHNVHFLTAKDGQTLVPGAKGEILPGAQTANLSFKTPAAGNYFYQCDVHPDQMTGTLEVKEGAAAPAASPAAGTPGTGATAATGSPAASPTTAR